MQEFIKHAKNRRCLVLRIKLFWIGYNYHKTCKTIFEPLYVKGMGIEDKKIGIELNLSKIFAPLYTIILEDVTFTKFAYWLIDWLKCCFHDREIDFIICKMQKFAISFGKKGRTIQFKCILDRYIRPFKVLMAKSCITNLFQLIFGMFLLGTLEVPKSLNNAMHRH